MSKVENRAHGRRARGSVGAAAGYDPGKLAREMQRLKANATPMNDSLHEYNTPKTAHRALQHKKIKPEQAIEVAYNLGLIRDQLSTTAMQAQKLIEQAATGDLGAFEVNASNDGPVKVAKPEQVLPADSGGMRPLTRNERRHAKKLEMNAREYLSYIANNPGMVIPEEDPKPKVKLIPMKQGQGQDSFTGNGLQEPNQLGRDEDQKEEMRSLPRQEKYEHQNRSTDTVQTESDNEPIPHEHAGPTRHAHETPVERVARLQRELEEAQREARQSTQLEKIKKKLAALDEGQISEVEAVIDDFLYADAAPDNVNVSEPVKPVERVAQGEAVSAEEIDELLENYGNADPKDI